MSDFGRVVIETTDTDEPFPVDALVRCRNEWDEVFVVQADIGTDALNWVFSDHLIDEQEAAAIVLANVQMYVLP